MAARNKLAVTLGRERRTSGPSSTKTWASPASSKPGAAQLQSKGARTEMELNFDRYCSLEKSSQADIVAGRGLSQLLSEIAVAPYSFDYYVVLWKLGATQRDCITRSEWVMTVYARGIESLTQLKTRVVEWVKEVRGSDASFLLMYNFLYDYIRGEDDRCMSLETAMKAWNVLFEKKEQLTQWQLWASSHVNTDVSRDLWRQVGLMFMMDTDPRKCDGGGNSSAVFPMVIAEFLKQNKTAA
ncbi:hypothetical protein ABL78_2682 [Leptomonas seymouri]|uniref:Defective in cullin neddylation protein n=1 Tax=Leptomonas seymouri TaxID=5684 RepID=A0A0N1I8Z2_LEPSE|nr:hypothetical protein ABL78_2682 [Leptomonas seymouri]|eukprot:KPI88258.1 hypothetical protein ABL78_2682 [Leptomonas seymouri]